MRARRRVCARPRSSATTRRVRPSRSSARTPIAGKRSRAIRRSRRRRSHSVSSIWRAVDTSRPRRSIARCCAARRAPRDAEAHIGLGKAFTGLQRSEEAEQSFREAIAAEPGYWLTYNALGGFLIAAGRSREAAEAYEHITQLAPSNPTGYNNLGAALLSAGELEASARAFEQSNSIEPSRAAYNNLGTLYYYLGRFDDAVPMYSKALELAPEDYRLWGGRGDSNWYRPQARAAAIADYRRAALMAEKVPSVNASDAEAWVQLGYYYGRLGEQDRAKRYVARALELGPDVPFVLYIAATRRRRSG